MRDDVQKHPAAQVILEAVWRSLERPEAPGLRKAVVQAMSRADIVTKGGIYLGTRPVFDVSLERLNRVASRTVWGLFDKLSGGPLPADYEARAYEVSGFKTADLQQHVKTLCQKLLAGPAALVLGDQVFGCWWSRIEQDPNLSLWLLVFYRKVLFIGATGPAADFPKL
jgi:hypothetical protein